MTKTIINLVLFFGIIFHSLQAQNNANFILSKEAKTVMRRALQNIAQQYTSDKVASLKAIYEKWDKEFDKLSGLNNIVIQSENPNTGQLEEITLESEIALPSPPATVPVSKPKEEKSTPSTDGELVITSSKEGDVDYPQKEVAQKRLKALMNYQTAQVLNTVSKPDLPDTEMKEMGADLKIAGQDINQYLTKAKREGKSSAKIQQEVQTSIEMLIRGLIEKLYSKK